MKNCFGCNTTKPLDEFYTHPGMKDGHLNKCKECIKADATADRNKNIDRVRAYDLERAKRPENRAKTNVYQIGYGKANQEKIQAQTAVRRALLEILNANSSPGGIVDAIRKEKLSYEVTKISTSLLD